jgi:hypothetical protein
MPSSRSADNGKVPGTMPIDPGGVVTPKSGVIVRSVPGWLISVLAHALLLLVATLFYTEQVFIEDESAYITQIRRPDAPKLDTLDQLPEKKKPKEEEAKTEEESTLFQEPAEPDSGPDSGGDPSGDLGAGPTLGVAGSSDIGSSRRVSASSLGTSGPKPRRAPTPKDLKAALRWLARHQNPDGSWSVMGFHKNCGRQGYSQNCATNEFAGNDQYDVGVTALALLAFLGGGYAPSNREQVYSPDLVDPGARDSILGGPKLTYGDVVKRALKYLISIQDTSGRLGRDVDRYIYNHMLGTVALCEAYGITRIWLLRGPTEKAVQFLIDSRGQGGAWRYGYRSADADSSVTGWAIMAIKSAETAGLPIDRSVHDGARRWFEQVTVKAKVSAKITGIPGWDEGRQLTISGYLGPKDAGRLVSVSGMNEHYAYTPSMTAMMMIASALMDGKLPPVAEGSVDTLLAFPPARWTLQDKQSWRRVDFYYLHHATYALSRVIPVEDDRWKSWVAAIREAVVQTQNLRGYEGICAEGSWEPVDRWSCEGGRVYATSICALTLEALYRFPKTLALEKKVVLIHANDD